MSDVTLLRKLTGKSILKFGKHAEVPIQTLLDLHENSYLRWVYYNCSAITFVDEILEQIRIPDNARIDKPGKDTELGEALQAWIFEGLSGIFKYRLGVKLKSRKRHKLSQQTKASKKINSRANLVRKNHGHKNT